jgi:hypothetical protein
MKSKWCKTCKMWVRRSHQCPGDDGVTLVTHPDGEVTAVASLIGRSLLKCMPEAFPDEPLCSICRRRHPNREPFTHACE